MAASRFQGRLAVALIAGSALSLVIDLIVYWWLGVAPPPFPIWLLRLIPIIAAAALFLASAFVGNRLDQVNPVDGSSVLQVAVWVTLAATLMVAIAVMFATPGRVASYVAAQVATLPDAERFKASQHPETGGVPQIRDARVSSGDIAEVKNIGASLENVLLGKKGLSWLLHQYSGLDPDTVELELESHGLRKPPAPKATSAVWTLEDGIDAKKLWDDVITQSETLRSSLAKDPILSKVPFASEWVQFYSAVAFRILLAVPQQVITPLDPRRSDLDSMPEPLAEFLHWAENLQKEEENKSAAKGQAARWQRGAALINPATDAVASRLDVDALVRALRLTEGEALLSKPLLVSTEVPDFKSALVALRDAVKKAAIPATKDEGHRRRIKAGRDSLAARLDELLAYATDPQEVKAVAGAGDPWSFSDTILPAMRKQFPIKEWEDYKTEVNYGGATLPLMEAIWNEWRDQFQGDNPKMSYPKTSKAKALAAAAAIVVKVSKGYFTLEADRWQGRLAKDHDISHGIFAVYQALKDLSWWPFDAYYSTNRSVLKERLNGVQFDYTQSIDVGVPGSPSSFSDMRQSILELDRMLDRPGRDAIPESQRIKEWGMLQWFRWIVSTQEDLATKSETAHQWWVIFYQKAPGGRGFDPWIQVYGPARKGVPGSPDGGGKLESLDYASLDAYVRGESTAVSQTKPSREQQQSEEPIQRPK